VPEEARLQCRMLRREFKVVDEVLGERFGQII
jgi:hypothetical protein